MRWNIAAMCLLLSSACGSDITPRPWDVDEAGDDVEARGDAAAVDDECTDGRDCADDEYCFRPPTCGEPRYCLEGYEPWSAAPPVAVCGCSGQRTSVNHGYPGPHAWPLGNLAGWDEPAGACDPTATAPFEYLIRFRVADVPADGTLLARLSETLDTDERIQPVESDGTVEFRATGDQWASFSIVLLNDRDGDGACAENTDNTYGTYTTDFDADLESFQLDIDVELQAPATVCANW